jgi:S-layer homology domain
MNMTGQRNQSNSQARYLPFGLLGLMLVLALGLTTSVALAGLPSGLPAQAGKNQPSGQGTTTTTPSATGTVTGTLTVTATVSTTRTSTRTATVVPATSTATGTVMGTVTVTATGTVESTSTGTVVSTGTRTATGTPEATGTTTPCAGGNGRVTICHQTGNGESHTITISCSALPAHLRHGDTVGPCPVGTPRSRGNPFRDVTLSDYFYDTVLDLHDAGAVSGYADNTFRPYDTTTRSQFVKMVVLALHFPLYSGSEQHFTDVPRDHPFYVYVETSLAEGLVSGYDNGTFMPYNNVTRGQVAKVTVNAAGFDDVSTDTATFSDVPVGSAFYNYVETAYANGILNGYTDGTFQPGAQATRGQASKIIDLATSR